MKGVEIKMQEEPKPDAVYDYRTVDTLPQMVEHTSLLLNQSHKTFSEYFLHAENWRHKDKFP